MLDSALPTGAFSHSCGSETYIHRGDIRSPQDFAHWLYCYIHTQLTSTEAVAVRLAYNSRTLTELLELDELMYCQSVPLEMRNANQAMGERFLLLAASNYEAPLLQEYRQAVEDEEAWGHTAVAWGVLAAHVSLPCQDALQLYLYNAVITLTQNAVRGVPLGHNAAQKIIRQAQAWCATAAQRSLELTEEDIGASPPGLELAQIVHERQHARLFMS